MKETSEHILIWEGYKLTKDEARANSGVPTIMWLDSFKAVLPALMNEAENVYLNSNEHIRAVVEVETRDARFIKEHTGEVPAASVPPRGAAAAPSAGHQEPGGNPADARGRPISRKRRFAVCWAL